MWNRSIILTLIVAASCSTLSSQLVLLKFRHKNPIGSQSRNEPSQKAILELTSDSDLVKLELREVVFYRHGLDFVAAILCVRHDDTSDLRVAFATLQSQHTLLRI